MAEEICQARRTLSSLPSEFFFLLGFLVLLSSDDEDSKPVANSSGSSSKKNSSGMGESVSAKSFSVVYTHAFFYDAAT